MKETGFPLICCSSVTLYSCMTRVLYDPLNVWDYTFLHVRIGHMQPLINTFPPLCIQEAAVTGHVLYVLYLFLYRDLPLGRAESTKAKWTFRSPTTTATVASVWQSTAQKQSRKVCFLPSTSHKAESDPAYLCTFLYRLFLKTCCYTCNFQRCCRPTLVLPPGRSTTSRLWLW